MDILRPKPTPKFITEADLERAELERIVLCDEANLHVFRLWYQFGGMKRPLTPMEAAAMPADLARDFTYLLNRLRELADNQMALDEWVNRNIFKEAEPEDAIYPDQQWS